MPSSRKKSNSDKQQIIFLGKLPPPYIGPSVACEIIINSKLKDEFQLIHLDTSDHRDINTLGKIDFGNIYYALKQYTMLLRYLLKYRDAIVYVPAGQTTVGYIRDAVFIVIAKMFGRKVITHLRGGNFLNWYNTAPGYAKWIVRRVHPRVDAQIILGNNLKRLFNWILPENKLHVIPNGGNYDVPPLQRNAEKIKILYLGNFIGTKGVLESLHAIEYLSDYGNKIEFVFAGEWRDEPTKTAFLQFQKNNPHLPVTLAGPVSGKAKFELLASCDIFVFPTYYPNEGHPWVIVEAMSASLPVISTDHAAISESVIEGLNGFLVQKRNAKEVADKIRYLLEHPETREQMGKESRKLYLEKFTKDIMIQKMGDVFRSVAAA